VNLTVETLILAVGMAALATLPMISSRVRAHSQTIFLLGTGALFGICFFDLMPDVFEIGGPRGLYVVAAVWAAYSLLHIFHMGHHSHEEHGEGQAASFFFLAALIAHCFASGMLLAVSQGMSPRIATTVFMALLAHKAYEALTLSSILVQSGKSRLEQSLIVGVYSLAVPAGVAVTTAFRDSMNEGVAMLISSIAVGTLLGCLIFDFLIPSVRHLKKSRAQAAWIAVGLVMTQLVMRSF
jgi:zinc transporter ZupT